MIYIKRKTAKKEKILRYDFDKAVRYILDLDYHDFLNGSVYIIGSEPVEELENFIRHFSPETFTVETDGVPYDSYKVNPNVPSKRRLLVSQATKKAIENFAVKISKQLGIMKNHIHYGANFFSMTFESREFIFDFVCSYKLEILNSYVKSKFSDFAYNTEETKRFETAINRIFTKQRYYYKKKDVHK